VKIVHAADLHIDCPLKGLDRYAGAPVDRLRGATRSALENLVSLCIGERADLLLLAGDVFDGTWKDLPCGTTRVARRPYLRVAKPTDWPWLPRVALITPGGWSRAVADSAVK
jgi:DNA repair protein SbcD/Mre11